MDLEISIKEASDGEKTINRIAAHSNAFSYVCSTEDSEHLGLRAQDVDVWKGVEAALKAKGEQISIRYEVFPPTEYDSKLLVSLQGGVGPDIMYTRRLPGARTQALLDNGYLTAINGLVDLSNFDDVSLSFISTDNKVWGVPLQTIIGIFYNKAIFDKYKLKEPQTWDEMVQIAETLRRMA